MPWISRQVKVGMMSCPLVVSDIFPRNTGTEFGLERQTLCRIYCAVLLSVLCYGSEKGWQSYHYHILTPQSWQLSFPPGNHLIKVKQIVSESFSSSSALLLIILNIKNPAGSPGEDTETAIWTLGNETKSRHCMPYNHIGIAGPRHAPWSSLIIRTVKQILTVLTRAVIESSTSQSLPPVCGSIKCCIIISRGRIYFGLLI